MESRESVRPSRTGTIKRPGLPGACRCERLMTCKHVPGRFSESTRLDASHVSTAMFANPGFGVSVPTAIRGHDGLVNRRFDERSTQVSWLVLGQRPTLIVTPGLTPARTQPGVRAELLG